MIDLNFCTDTIRLMLLGLVLAASVGEATATLGQAPSTLPASSTSTPAVGARMLAATPTVRSSLYTLHEVQLENGTIVREYATPAGQVFAVAWRGPVLPDLSALLGGYFNTFKAETDQARHAGLVSFGFEGIEIATQQCTQVRQYRPAPCHGENLPRRRCIFPNGCPIFELNLVKRVKTGPHGRRGCKHSCADRRGRS